MATFDIADVDRNLAVAEKVNAPDLTLHDVRKPPFQIYGLYDPQNEPVFKRMSSDVAKTVSDGVKWLHLHTAGGRVRFSTDSPYVVIQAVMSGVYRMPHMPLTGTSAFDLYLDSPDGRYSRYYRTFVPPHRMENGYESKHLLPAGKNYLTIHFPLYNSLDTLYIGVAKDSVLAAGAPYRTLDPVVYYGSSITQGGCASRPGNTYQAMVSRVLNVDHINLGFSGGAHGEQPMLDYMASLAMSAFVCDYDHNAGSVKELHDTHQQVYDTIRSKHPHIPFVILSRPDFERDETSPERREVLLNTFH